MDSVAPDPATIHPQVARPVTFRAVFAVGEFRSVWLAQILSVAGDQLARVAMTVLVYDRTGSAFWSAATYAVTLVPWLLGGLALSGLADRRPRRDVMVVCDLARVVLVGVMALLSLHGTSDLGLGVMVALLFVVTLLDSPFKSARAALAPDILTGDLYVLGVAVSQTALQAGLVAGFALGGIVVASLHVSGALVFDAGTFAVSALLVRFGVRSRPAAARRPPDGSRRGSGELGSGIRLVFGSGALRTLVMFGWLVAFYIVPMGLAAPFARSLHSGLSLPVAAGLIFAAGPLGTLTGAIAVSRFVPPGRRQQWMAPLAVLACGALLFLGLRPGFAASLVIIALSGACASYQLAANSAFVAAVPPDRRGQAFGLANGGMQVLQGLWILLAGAAVSARLLAPGTMIAISGGVGAVLAAVLAVGQRRASARRGAPAEPSRSQSLSGRLSR